MLGDSTGIGPEQCARVLADRRLADVARLLVVGDARLLEQGARDADVDLAYEIVSTPEQFSEVGDAVAIIDLGNCDPSTVARGAISADAGRVAGETLATMIELALDGRIEGICFAPLNKAALHAGGWRFNDEHQMFAHLTRHQGFFGEMNVLDNLWMSRVTSHVALRTALDQITPERIDEALTLADRTMRGAGFGTAAHRGMRAESARGRKRSVRPRGNRHHCARCRQSGRAWNCLQRAVSVRHGVPESLRRRI